MNPRDQTPNAAAVLDTAEKRTVLRTECDEGEIRGRHEAISDALREDARALASIFSRATVTKNNFVHDFVPVEIAAAVRAAKNELRSAWTSRLLDALRNAKLAEHQRALNSPTLPALVLAKQSTPWHVLSTARSEVEQYAHLSPIPEWVTVELVEWLLRKYNPGRSVNGRWRGGGGRRGGKYTDGRILELLASPPDLAKELARDGQAGLAAIVR